MITPYVAGWRVAGWTAVAVLAGCGANVVFGEDGGDGGGGSSSGPGTSSGPSSTTATGTTSTGSPLCDDHIDCGPGMLCVFDTSTCILACDAQDGSVCPPGFRCDACATSSCPGCLDCVSGCVFDDPSACSSHQDCVDQGLEVCIFSASTCSRRCGPGSPPCPPAEFCLECATSSCPGCRDCVAACVPEFK